MGRRLIQRGNTEYADEGGETSGLKIIKTIHGPRVLGDIEAGNGEGDSARGERGGGGGGVMNSTGRRKDGEPS